MNKKEKQIIITHNSVCMTSMEWGYIAHERGINIEQAREEFARLLKVE